MQRIEKGDFLALVVNGNTTDEDIKREVGEAVEDEWTVREAREAILSSFKPAPLHIAIEEQDPRTFRIGVTWGDEPIWGTYPHASQPMPDEEATYLSQHGLDRF